MSFFLRFLLDIASCRLHSLARSISLCLAWRWIDLILWVRPEQISIRPRKTTELVKREIERFWFLVNKNILNIMCYINMVKLRTYLVSSSWPTRINWFEFQGRDFEVLLSQIVRSIAPPSFLCPQCLRPVRKADEVFGMVRETASLQTLIEGLTLWWRRLITEIEGHLIPV